MQQQIADSAPTEVVLAPVPSSSGIRTLNYFGAACSSLQRYLQAHRVLRATLAAFVLGCSALYLSNRVGYTNIKPWRTLSAFMGIQTQEERGDSDEDGEKETEVDLPLEARCQQLRQKIFAMCSPANASLVFEMTQDSIIEQSSIKFICQKKIREASIEEKAPIEEQPQSQGVFGWLLRAQRGPRAEPDGNNNENRAKSGHNGKLI